jgi:predicted amidohydrolase YtcJ
MCKIAKCAAFIIGCFFTQIIYGQSADVIFTNGKIFTSDDNQLYVQAVAIKGNRILAAGNNEAIKKLAGANTRRIDLQGKTVIPGINDAHDHIGYGAPVARFISFNAPMLPGPTLTQVLDSIKIAVTQVPKGTIIQGHVGLLLIEDSSARRAALDAVAPDHPVILNVPWGHGTIVNTKAMQMLGIDEEAKDPVGGGYERIAGSQKMSGLLKEYAEFSVVRKWQSKLPDSILIKVFKNYSDNAIKLGITSVQNMATSLELDKTVSVINAANLPLRIRVIRFPGSNANGREIAKWSKVYPATSRLHVSGMKWVLDATPLERGALMEAAYSDKPGWKGQLNFPIDTVRSLLKEGLFSKEQLLLHIVGDATPNIVIHEMLQLANASAWKSKRVRFEHADGLMQSQWQNVKAMGIVTVANPAHFTFAEINHTRVGEERSATYQPLRSLIEAGIPVALGSDGPNNPYLNMMFAAMHPTNPKEAITIEQAVKAYTKGSAYAEFMEKEKGMIKAGMLADLVVLSQDIFSIPLQALPATESVLTMINGKIVYSTLTVR